MYGGTSRMTEKAEPQRQERSSWTTRLWRAGGILQDSTSERLVDSGLHQGPFGLGGDSPERAPDWSWTLFAPTAAVGDVRREASHLPEAAATISGSFVVALHAIYVARGARTTTGKRENEEARASPTHQISHAFFTPVHKGPTAMKVIPEEEDYKNSLTRRTQ
ncbi:hypothetical protein BGZ61DRAFT_474306 [Ilyonectria robusta]|uniref:uncharacterized protein n=1 Tax=Ilyonectria robusta TaxID=1079257 RepID=UPI001E8E9CCC|nr:uncharacterized protein BGZ61DRAFT_474306 [Ilyonectria robusta]KAH8733643.1 hypothetical protein BGZ61DRAFT_474306 [Ilyonectria robusta]